MSKMRCFGAGAVSLAVTVCAAGLAWGESDAATREADALSALLVSPMCFPEFMTREEMLEAVRRYGLRPPAEGLAGDPRFSSDPFVWTGDPVTIGFTGRAERATLTYSFPEDGVTWGLASIDPSSVQANTLSSAFATHFGDVDRGREFVRQALAVWARSSGLYYREVADDQSAMDVSSAHLPWRGDIRIGGAPASGSPYVAYNAFPITGGDMFVDTTAFNILNFTNPANNFRFFRNVMSHEHGHGLALRHAVPCTQTKLMEPQVATAFDGLTPDEVRGAARSYNDVFAPNHDIGSAHWLGDLVPIVFLPPPGSPPTPVPRSFGARNLSLNGDGGPNNTGSDWFMFEMSADVSNFTVIASPSGGTYDTGVQTTGCAGTVSTIVADAIGDLEIELLDLITGNTWIASANGFGAAETLGVPTLPAGLYAVRITDLGPSQGDQVQLYDLSILVGSPPPPAAFAGLDKRCRANAPCWFMADVNSYAVDPNAVILGYEWDIDGDGAYELPGPAQTSFVFPSSGEFDVSVRVVDSNGMLDEDQVRVTVHGATTLIQSVTPGYGYLGRGATVQITGANFLIPSTLQASGVGIQVVAFGATNAFGTEAGAFLFIDPSTPLGFYDLRVTNAEGADTLIGQFQVRCVGDLDGDNVINFNDLNALLGVYNQVLPGHPADFIQNGVIDFADLNFLLGLYNTNC